MENLKDLGIQGYGSAANTSNKIIRHRSLFKVKPWSNTAPRLNTRIEKSIIRQNEVIMRYISNIPVHKESKEDEE